MPGDSLPVRPWHLPGSERGGAGDAGPWHRGETGSGTPFRTPALDAEAAGELGAAVREAAVAARREIGVEGVIEAASEAALRLADPTSRAGDAAASLLSAELGWPGTLARETLERMAEGWTEDALRHLVRAELGDPGVLDGFRPDPGRDGAPRRRRAVGPQLLLQVQAGNVPGVGVTGMIRALLARSGVVARPSRAEPGLAALFARCLARVSPALGRAAAVCWWPRDAGATWDALAQGAGVVVVYGGEDAVRALRSRVPPATELVAYGPKLGAAVLLPDADPAAAAADLARDVCAYEQRGCVSPRVVFVPERRREAVARSVDAALAAYVERHDVPPLTAAEATAIRDLRARVEFDGSGGQRLVGDAGELRWTVIAATGPGVRSEGLPRVVRVAGVAGAEGAADRVRALAPRVQAVGYAGREGLSRLADAAAAAGVSRVAPLGRMAWPPADWRHDGRHQLLPLLRWCDWELPGD